MAATDRRRATLLRGLSPSRALRVCDVGANPLSVPPYQPLLAGGAAEVHGFEPNQDALAKLKAVAGPNERYHPFAIGRPGERTLYLHHRSGFTSLYPMDGAALARIGKSHFNKANRIREERLTTVALDDVPGLPQIDLLKMDVQGAEVEILETGTKRLSDAIAVITEVRFHRIYADEPMFGDQDQVLRAMGFRLYKFLFTKSAMLPHAHEAKVQRKRMTSQLLDGDAVYLRDVDMPDAFTDDQLAHMALCAEVMFDAPDLVLHCLDALAARGRVAPGLADDYIAHLPDRQRAEPEVAR
ncbi:MAG: FkbM family methyltransferase [Pseudomonadota bacterium]